jgi:hypothetical protein
LLQVLNKALCQIPTIGKKTADKLLDQFGEKLIKGMLADNIYQFVNFISKMHVLSLVETWSDSGKPKNSIAGFTLLCNNTRTKHKKARRCSENLECSTFPYFKDYCYIY